MKDRKNFKTKILINTAGTTKSAIQINRVKRSAEKAAAAMERLVDAIADLKDILCDKEGK